MTNSNNSLKVPYHKILEETRLKLAIAKKYLPELQAYGITQQWINELEQKANEAEQFITNHQQLEQIKALTAAKNAALDACVKWGIQLRFRMELIFNNQTITEIQFPHKDFNDSRKSVSKMLTLMPSLITIAKEHQEKLKAVGQTLKTIQQGETLLSQLEKATAAQKQYQFERTTVTQQRKQLFQELYEGVNYINKTGQVIYGNDSAESSQFRSNWKVISVSSHQ